MKKTSLVLLFAVTSSLVTTANAQFGDLLRKVQNLGDLTKSATDTVSAIKSISDVTTGLINPGAAEADLDGKVVMYSTAWCGFCKRAIAHMKANSVPFVEKDIEMSAAYRAEYKKYGTSGGVPFLIIGRQTMLGFNPDAFNSKYAEFKKESVGVKAAPVLTAVSAATPATPAEPKGVMGSSSLFSAGDTLTAKINGIRIYSEPMKTSSEAAVLVKSDEFVYLGEEKAGFIKISSGKGDGWVDKLLVRKL